MRTSINAIVNVINPVIRRNREVVARGVDALRASGPGYRMFHAMHPDHLGLVVGPRGGLRLLDSRSSLIASSAWRSLPVSAGSSKAKRFAGTCFTSTTCTAALQQPQAPGRGERQAVLAALPIARLSASA
jgi:hypothetical protein